MLNPISSPHSPEDSQLQPKQAETARPPEQAQKNGELVTLKSAGQAEQK